ncbi:hypothetical protein [Jannaschia rubra]|uniref:hypothetical protein n=1 Tax=Jannaschia rubra TaxID=282197 RepID=UPI0024939EFD|nr:hypothetical protein [Jannaschia rubra]
MSANPPLIHPGPAAPERHAAVPTRAALFDVTLAPGDCVERAILDAFAAQGFVSGWVRMDGLICDPLRYVLPAPSPTPDRLAWYSGTQAPDGPARTVQGYMSVGRRDGAADTHCHALWRLSDGGTALGHLLAGESRAARPATLRAMGFHDARFERRADPETRFDLFAATGTPSDRPDAVAVTLRPNESLAGTCRAICAGLGIAGADIVGLGSLNGAVFADGARMRSPISEFLVRRGRIDGEEVTLDLGVVDAEGNRFDGPVDPGCAAVSVTAELVILPDREAKR